ncbi:MAG: phenylalanine--tRNA ligase subunit beta, partial [Alphaproteobacteria bacterium]
MKFTLNWLKEYLDTNATLEEICNKLTMIGLEVEEVIDKSLELKDFIIAEIISAEQHPNAEKLRVCKVNNGKEILQIVCAAPNARAGIKVVLAPIGAIIPANGMIIKKSKIRDVESEGMMCSLPELKIEGENNGTIIELDTDAKPGDNFVKYAELDDAVIEIVITANRGDCLGVYGVARELAAAGLGELKEINYKEYSADSASLINVEVKSDLCPAYYGLYFSDIDNNKELEEYAKRLEAIGVKSHSPIVDITNYISYCYGRPSHAYDADKIKGNIIVRSAKKDEKFKSLADIDYNLTDELVIADEEKVLALAGIIGGANSACTEDTKNIFVEIALFDSISIAKTGRKFVIDTDARYKFERKLDPLFLDTSANIFYQILTSELNAKAHKIIKAVSGEFKPKHIQFNIDKIESMGGMNIPNETICDILSKLGFKFIQNGNILDLTIPSWRNDIGIEADIVEEVLRIYGYDNLNLYPI